VHHLNADGVIEESVPEVIEIQRNNVISPSISIVVSQVNMDRFRAALLLWIVIAYMALSCVENTYFQSYVKLLNPRMYEFLYTSSNTIRQMVTNDFSRKKLAIKAALSASLSKIYISFDLWTSPH
jgi:hypothetical protein